MSHSISITIRDIESKIEILNKLENELKESELSSKNSHIETIKRINYDHYFTKIQELKTSLANSVGNYETDEELYLEVLRRISTLDKEVNNIRLLYLSEREDKLLDFMSDDVGNNQILELVIEYGYLATESIKYLEKNNIAVTASKLNETIATLRQQESDKVSRQELKEKCTKRIFDSKLPDSIKYNLLNIMREYKTNQELSDYWSYLQSIESDAIELNRLVRLFKEILEKEGFSIVPGSYEYGLSNHLSFFTTFKLKHPTNGLINIFINSNGQIQYKIGDYENHVCESTTSKLINDLKLMGCKVHVDSVKRNIDNNRPLNSMKKEIGK